MTATNPKALAYRAARLFVAPKPAALPELAYDLSNAGAIITAIAALTLKRIASITDFKITMGIGDIVTTETDDNGTIYSATTPTCVIDGNRYEMFQNDVLKTILGLVEIDDTTNNRVILGQKIAPIEVPDCILVAETIPQPDAPVSEKIYVIDTELTSSIVLNFADVVRAGGVGNTPFTFTTKRNGGWFKVTPTA
ncbi:MAG: hypothetical protein LBU27_09150 [Candidatus Peribacteria bacterium]|jgi:hypothetical protein|nr:hypothetical protein [Candidatus Peribacteria bacterium]